MLKFVSSCLVLAMVTGPASTPIASASDVKTATPIRHIVIIFGDNESFDHYFGNYPNGLNPDNEPQFQALVNTPTVNGLDNALLGTKSQPQSAQWQRCIQSFSV
jgi:phospholipase C